MLHRILALFIVFSLGLGGVTSAQDTTPAATTSSDGPVMVTGTLNASNFAASIIYPSPTVALVDASALLPLPKPEFAPRDHQIIGIATSPLFTSTPGTYEVSLPFVPTGEPFAISADAAPSDGLMAFYLVIGSNITGDSYLEQLEQFGETSFLTDPTTQQFTEGSLILFAADDQQQFPSAAGADGLWFTADDELTTLEPGYTVVHLASDGTATFDRSAAPTMDTVESAAVTSPDYSSMTWVDAFNALIDRLEERYSFTEVRNIDWEALRAEYGPRIQQAQDDNDIGAYLGALFELAAGVEDAHVSVQPTTAESLTALQQFLAPLGADYAGNIGAYGTLVTDPANPGAGPGDTFEIVSVGDDSPAQQAGWLPGTQIVSINGQSIPERLEQIPPWLIGSAISTPEKARFLSSQALLLFPVGETVTIEYIQPDESDVRSVDLVVGQYDQGAPAAPTPTSPAPLETSTYTDIDGYTVIKWADFEQDIPERIAVLEAALAHQQTVDGSKGIILDMRGNSGGWAALYMTMASYFFSADNPMPTGTFDSWEYDETAGELVRNSVPDYLLSSPKPNLAYTGPLTVLVDQNCGSSCEFFTQTLQALGRATVIGQYATAGAGGNIDQALMPGDVIFQYTVGQYTYAGTDELNLEAKGVLPDVRVPVTVETVTAQLEGEDVVLDYAIAWLDGDLPTDDATPVSSPIASPMAATPAA